MVSINYIPFFEKCRLGNQLYFALNAYKCGFILKEDVRQNINSKLKDLYDKLNVFNYSIDGRSIPCSAIRGNNAGKASMFQEFGVCYDENILNSFIRDTILKSEVIKNTIPQNRISVQIRGGDYITASQGFQFNSHKFLTDALALVNDNIGIDVFTDDKKYVEDQLIDVLLRKNNDVRLIECTDPATDLVKSTLYRMKIIWNSTYAYWSAYVSNAFFGNNHKNIIAPRSFAKNVSDGRSFHLNPRWTILEY